MRQWDNTNIYIADNLIEATFSKYSELIDYLASAQLHTDLQIIDLSIEDVKIEYYFLHQNASRTEGWQLTIQPK